MDSNQLIENIKGEAKSLSLTSGVTQEERIRYLELFAYGCMWKEYGSEVNKEALSLKYKNVPFTVDITTIELQPQNLYTYVLLNGNHCPPYYQWVDERCYVHDNIVYWISKDPIEVLRVGFTNIEFKHAVVGSASDTSGYSTKFVVTTSEATYDLTITGTGELITDKQYNTIRQHITKMQRETGLTVVIKNLFVSGEVK